jgi:uncharacterized damage-inducible protein DinB
MLALVMPTHSSPDSFRDALLTELDVAERQLLGVANTMPTEKFSWRPDATARTVSEALVHVAAGHFFLLTLVGHPPPNDIYGEIVGEGKERLWSLVRRNDELEKGIRDKGDVIKFLERSLHAVRGSIKESTGAALADPTTCKVYMRMMVHLHEHMGQMIAYLRMNGLSVPWPDWRPDRRP